MSPENTRTNRNMDIEWRELDPIETTEPGYDDSLLVEIAEENIPIIDRVLSEDRSLTAEERARQYAFGGDLRLEWLYAEHGGEKAELVDFNRRLGEAGGFFAKARKDARESYDTHPERVWGIVMKQHDLRALQVYRNAREAETTLKDTPASAQAWDFAENQMGDLLNHSIKFIQELQKYVDHPEHGQLARGLLFENLLMTYQRQQTYERQELDQVFTRSALGREDRPRNYGAYPKRAIDIVIEEPGDKRLIQAKNYNNQDEYAEPIEKVTASRFHRTIANLDTYIGDLQLLIRNPGDPNVKGAMDTAAKRLDDVFGSLMVKA